MTGLTGVVTQVAAGTMGLALRSDGTVWQWGITASTPVRVPGLTGVTKISAGTSFNLALRSDGTVWAWGDNDRGQQLRPAGQDPSSSPATRPVSMFAAGSGITQLSAGWSHMLALKSNGTVLAWGSNIFGQLGNGSRDPVIGPVQVTGLTAAMQVAAGARGFSLAVHTVPYLVGL